MSSSLIWHGERVKAKLRTRRSVASLEAAKALLEAANVDGNVPVISGKLRDSGSVAVDDGTGLASVTYDVPYAARTHEDMTENHPNGRSKWLQRTQDELAHKLIETMGAVVAEELI